MGKHKNQWARAGQGEAGRAPPHPFNTSHTAGGERSASKIPVRVFLPCLLTPPGHTFVLSLCFTSQTLELLSVFLAALKGDRHILTN